MPTVFLVFAGLLAGGQLATQQLRLQEAASGAARAIARGETIFVVTQRVLQLVPGSAVQPSSRDGLDCVTVFIPAAEGVGLAAMVTLRASGCVLTEHR